MIKKSKENALIILINNEKESIIDNWNKTANMNGVYLGESKAMYDISSGGYLTKELLIIEEAFKDMKKLDIKLIHYSEGKKTYEFSYKDVLIESCSMGYNNYDERPYINFNFRTEEEELTLFED